MAYRENARQPAARRRPLLATHWDPFLVHQVHNELRVLAIAWTPDKAQRCLESITPKLPPEIRDDVAQLLGAGRVDEAIDVVRERAGRWTLRYLLAVSAFVAFLATVLGGVGYFVYIMTRIGKAVDTIGVVPGCDRSIILDCHRQASAVGNISGRVVLTVGEGGRVIHVGAESGAGKRVDECLERRFAGVQPPDAGNELTQHVCAYVGKYSPSTLEITVNRTLLQPAKACQNGDARGCLAWGQALQAHDAAVAAQAFTRGCALSDAASCTLAGNLAFPHDLQAAEQSWSKACDLDPSNACSLAAELLLETGKPNAERYAKAGCDAGDAASCASLSLVMHARGQREEALRLASGACEAGSAAGCARQARLLLLDGALDEAVSWARRAVRTSDAQPAAHRALGHAMVARGDLDEAAGAYRRAVKHAHEALSGAVVEPGEASTIASELAELRKAQPRWSAHIDAVLKRRDEWSAP